MCNKCGNNNCSCYVTKTGERGPAGPMGPKGNNGNGYLTATVSLTTSQVKNLHGTPVVIVGNPGAGKSIEVISATAKLIFGTAAFSNSTIALTTDTAGAEQTKTGTGFLSQTATGEGRFNSWNTSAFNVKENASLFAMADANSATGDGSVNIYVCYRIITL